MLAREIFADYVLPILLMIVTALLRQLFAAWQERAKSAKLDTQLASLERIAEAAVSQVENTIVRDLKNPSKPGTWDDVAMHSAKEAAITLAKSMAPQIVDQLGKQGSDIQKLLEALVEKAVLKVKATVATTRAASVPPPPVTTPPVAPTNA